jgi:hypothetical protein
VKPTHHTLTPFNPAVVDQPHSTCVLLAVTPNRSTQVDPRAPTNTPLAPRMELTPQAALEPAHALIYIPLNPLAPTGQRASKRTEVASSQGARP